MVKVEEKGKEFKQESKSYEELKQALYKLLEDPEKYADDAIIIAAKETASKFKEIISSNSEDRYEKVFEISNAFKKLYGSCDPYLSDEAKKKISEILEAKL
jgi:hypothetical protein